MDREFELDNYKSNFHDVNQRLKDVEQQLQESENELFSLQTEYQNLKYSEAAKEDVLRRDLEKQTNRLQEYKLELKKYKKMHKTAEAKTQELEQETQEK